MARIGERLARQLIGGIRLGSLGVPHSLALHSVKVAENSSHIAYTFGPPEGRIVVEPLSDRPCYAKTRCFNVLLQRPPNSPPPSRALLAHVVDVIRAAEPEVVVWSPKPTLFLVPGVLCDPADLSVRAVELLRRVPNIIVEKEKEHVSRDILSHHGIDAASKRFFEVPPPEAALRAIGHMISADEDACLFGADEGLPGFCDPGKEMLEAAEAESERVQVRCVGGTSALAMALMRLPIPINRFVFQGTTAPDSIDRAREELQKGYELPKIFFLTYDVPGTGRRAVEVFLPLGAEVLIACNLTGDDEWVARYRPGMPHPTHPPLDSTARAVLVIRPLRASNK